MRESPEITSNNVQGICLNRPTGGLSLNTFDVPCNMLQKDTFFFLNVCFRYLVGIVKVLKCVAVTDRTLLII